MLRPAATFRWACSGAPLLVVLVAGCGAAVRQVPQRTVELEPVRVTASRGGQGEVVLDAYDARDLLERGNEALASSSWGEALAEYDRLLREFPESPLAAAASYNAGLALAGQGELAGAAARYRRAAELAATPRDGRDALFQAAGCFEGLGQWQQAADLLGEVLDRTDPEPHERLEAMARRGAALVEAGQLDGAEIELRRAVALARREGDDAVRTDYYLAQAQHHLGEVYRARISQVALTSDEVAFRRALERRAELLLRAQTQYVQAIRIGNVHWAAASAYRIGDMYASLFNEILDVPVPDPEVPGDLSTAAEVEAFRAEYPRHYRRLLAEYLEPLLHNAIRWWETNLMMIERTGVRGEWLRRTRDELDRVRERLDRIQAETEAPAEEGPSSARPPRPVPCWSDLRLGEPRRPGNLFA